MKRKINNLAMPLIIIIICSFFLVSPQIYKHALIVSNDWIFHMNRFYETAMQIHNGTFNYFQSIYGFDQSARVINALYGTDFAYINGVILLITKNWFRFQIVSTFLCYFTAGCSLYSLARYININKNIALGAALLYMGTPTIFYYAVAQNFSGWGAAFLPIAFIPAIRMIKNKINPINPIILGSSIALLISVHMFSTILAVLALIPFFIIGFIINENKLNMIKEAVFAVLIAIGLSFNTFAAYLDLAGNKLIAPHEVNDMLSNSTFLSLGSIGWTNFGLILSIIFLIQILFTVIYFKNLGVLEKTLTLTGTTFLILSSKYIPWNSIGSHLTFIRKIQFPQRFGCIACILLIVGFCLTIQKINLTINNKIILDFTLAIFMSISLLNLTGGYALVSDASNVWNSDSPLSRDTSAAESLEKDPSIIRNKFGGKSTLSAALKIYRKPTSDYLPVYSTGTEDTYNLYKKDIFNNKTNFVKDITPDGKLKISFNSDSTNEMTIPIIVYNHTTIEMNNRKINKTDYDLSSIGALKIHPKQGDNEILIGYNPNFLFKISFIIRIVTVLILITIIVIKKKRTQRALND